jgi:LAS superfamily LD-carboxypeptidase LdcB
MRITATRAGATFQAGSSFRTLADQRRLVHLYSNEPGRAARPGYSTHQTGIAIDTEGVNAAGERWLRANGRKYGFMLPGYAYQTLYGDRAAEEWHWEYRTERLPNAVREFYGLPELPQDAVATTTPVHKPTVRRQRQPPRR